MIIIISPEEPSSNIEVQYHNSPRLWSLLCLLQQSAGLQGYDIEWIVQDRRISLTFVPFQSCVTKDADTCYPKRSSTY